MQNIKLGSKVRDRITTLEGIATSRTEYLNGCVRYAVQPVGLKDGKIIDPDYVDVEQLEVIEEPEDKKVVPSGGPRDAPRALPNPR